MKDSPLNVTRDPAGAREIVTARPDGLEAALGRLTPGQAAYLRAAGFSAKAQELVLLPSEDGIDTAMLGLGQDRSPYAFGGLAMRLPERTSWHLRPGDFDRQDGVLGFCLGGYAYTALKAPSRTPSLLVVEAADAPALSQASATWMVRDLINAPANVLGPAELADAASALADRHGATVERVLGEDLAASYPAAAAVGAGSARPPVVVTLRWRGSAASADAPLVSLCGKGVCFDSGGLDLKPSAGMLRMKKDMGGAAMMLGLARLVMEADLPVRLAVRLGCVENSVSGSSMRPLDVIRTRRGLTVEIGNTDAEGRLVLCDLLAEASDERPAILVDSATLTGAARVALGPDLPALFTDDESWAAELVQAGMLRHDPLWRLPLWDGYAPWLESRTADMNNVSSKPFAGAIIAGLFLKRFVAPGTPWIHTDVYAWNDQHGPGRPEGGEAQTIRAIFGVLGTRYGSGFANRKPYL